MILWWYFDDTLMILWWYFSTWDWKVLPRLYCWQSSCYKVLCGWGMILWDFFLFFSNPQLSGVRRFCQQRKDSIEARERKLKRASNCSMIANTPPKGVSFSDFIRNFTMSFRILLVCNSNTKISEISDTAKSWATYCCPGAYKKY